MLAIAPAWPRKCAPIATFSSTLMSGTSLTCWNVLAMPSFATCCGRALSIFLPSTEIVPPDGASTPVIRLKVVLLPAPFGTNQRHDLASPDIERDVIDRDHAAEFFAGMLDLQQAGGSGRGSDPRRQRRVMYRVVCD